MANNTPTTPTNGHLNLGSIERDNSRIEGYELYDFNSLIKNDNFFKKFEIEQEDYVYDLEPQSNNLFFVANFEENSNFKNSLFNVQYRVQSIEIPSLTYEYETDQITKIPLIKNGKSSYEVSITWLEDVYHSIYSYHEKWLDSWYDYRHNLLRVGQYGRFRKCSIVTYHYVKSGDIFNPTYTAQPIMLIQLNGLVPKGLPSLKFSYSEDQSDQLLTLEYLCSDYNIIYNKDFASASAEVWNPELAFNKGFVDEAPAGASNDQSEKERIIYAATGLTFSGNALDESLQSRRNANLNSMQESFNADMKNQTAVADANASTVSKNTAISDNNTKNNTNSSTTTEDPIETARKAMNEAEAAALDKNNKDPNKKAKFDEAKKKYEIAKLNQMKTDLENLKNKNKDIDEDIKNIESLKEGLYENDPKLKEYNGKIAELEKQKETNNILIKSKEEDIINQQNIINPPPKEPPETKTGTKPTKEVVDSLDEEKKKDLSKLTSEDLKNIAASQKEDTAKEFVEKNEDGDKTFIVDKIGVGENNTTAIVVQNQTEYRVLDSEGKILETGTISGDTYTRTSENYGYYVSPDRVGIEMRGNIALYN